MSVDRRELRDALRAHRVGDAFSVARLRALRLSTDPEVARQARHEVAEWVWLISATRPWMNRYHRVDSAEVAGVVAEGFLYASLPWLDRIEETARDPLSNDDYGGLILRTAHWRALDLVRRHSIRNVGSLERSAVELMEVPAPTDVDDPELSAPTAAAFLEEGVGLASNTVTKAMKLVDPTGTVDVFRLLAEGFTEADVADILGVKANALRQRLFRARTMLRKARDAPGTDI